MKLFGKKDKYNIEPEDNIPQEVYGIPNSMMENKYNIEPEDNIPQKVYGVPNSMMENKSDINKDSIIISIKNNNNDYVLSLSHTSKPEINYRQFIINLYSIINNWQDNYLGESKVEWSIKIDTKDNKRLIYGHGDFPSNWNEFIDLISKYEKAFINNIKIDIDKIGYNKISLTEIINSKFKDDPFWADLIIKYFKEEEKVNDSDGKKLFKLISNYDDILNEFTGYLNLRTYDLKNAIEINGYTAKKIHELNPQISPIAIYIIMGLLRSDPIIATKIINQGSKGKDIITNFVHTNED